MVLEYHELGVQFSFLLSNTTLAKMGKMGKKNVS